MSEYARLRELIGATATVEPSSDEGRAEIHKAIADGRVASVVDEGEQVFSLAGLGYGREAVADALDIPPERVDELAAGEIADLQRKLGGGDE